MSLTWIRTQDGNHNGRPVYDYDAIGVDGVKYSITWAYDHGGTFGYTARDPDGKQLHPGYIICWSGSLKRCKDACEKIEATRKSTPDV